jgi:hypothetical protein
MVDIQTASIVIASAGVLAGVIYYTLELRHQAKIRQMDLLMRLFSTFNSNGFQEEYIKLLDLKITDYDDYVKTYGLKGLFKIFPFFEAVGIMLNRKMVSLDLVEQMYSQSIQITWEKSKPIQEGLRKKYNQPKWGEWFEYLYVEVKKREHQLASKTA